MSDALATARDYLERARSVADARGDRAEVRFIAGRICEILELLDLDEARRLRAEPTLDVADPADGEGDPAGDGGHGPPSLVADMKTDGVTSLGASPLSVLAAMNDRHAEREAERGASLFQLRYLGDPVLATVCRPIHSLDEIPDGLIEAMRRIVNHASPPGLGLAANQVGATVRVILVRLAKSDALQVMINPVLSRFSASKTWVPEGCLSIPGFQTNMHRASWLTVDYRDDTWKQQRHELSGLAAQVVQHEVDHIEGKLLVDGLSRQLRRKAERSVAKVLGR